MTYSPIDDKTARYESDIRGYGEAPINHQPDTLATVVTGGSDVTFGASGANVDVGYNAGDEASLVGAGEGGATTFSPMDIRRREIFYQIEENDKPTSEVRIGFINPSDATSGAYIDVTNEQLRVGTTTVSITHPGSDTGIYAVIEADQAAGETRFDLSGGVSITETISGTDLQTANTICQLIGDGTSESVKIPYVREEWRITK